MKRTFLFLSFLFFSFFHLQGQTDSKPEFTAGLKAGLNLSNLNQGQSNDGRYSSIASYHAGAFLNLKGRYFGFQPELIYSRQGGIFSNSIYPINVDTRYDYLNVPLMVKFYAFWGIYLQAGPQFGYLLSARKTTTEDPNGPNNLPNVITFVNGSIKSSQAQTDLSGSFGIGCDLPHGFTFDARYNIGFVNVSSEHGSIRNKTGMFSIGYKFVRPGK